MGERTQIITIMDTMTMADASIIRLVSWLSPAFPIGGFAYSAGLEQAVAQDIVRDAAGLKDWLAALLAYGAPWNDAILLAAAWHAAEDGAMVCELAQLAQALAGSAERHKETMDQGGAFAQATRHWFDPSRPLPACLPLPVAVGLACGRADIDLEPALGIWINAFVSNQLQCAIRLSVIGQDSAARLLSELEPMVVEAAARASHSTLDDLGSCAIVAEMASMNHEILQPRLFLS